MEKEQIEKLFEQHMKCCEEMERLAVFIAENIDNSNGKNLVDIVIDMFAKKKAEVRIDNLKEI